MTEKYPVYKFQIDEIDEIYIEVIKKWCEDNCNGFWDLKYSAISTVDDTVRMYFTFIEEAEAVAFKLRWL